MTLDTNCTHTLWNTHTLYSYTVLIQSRSSKISAQRKPNGTPLIMLSILVHMSVRPCYARSELLNASTMNGTSRYSEIWRISGISSKWFPSPLMNIPWISTLSDGHSFLLVRFSEHIEVSFIRFGEYASNAGLSATVEVFHLKVLERLRGRHFSTLGLQHPSALNATCPFFILANAFTHLSPGNATDGFLGLDCR